MGLGLNLAGADLSGTDFEAIPSGTYHCSVFDIKKVATKGGEGSALPKGTPGINVHFKVEQEMSPDGEMKVKNRRLFRNLYIAPAKIGGKAYEHKGTMDRILGQFFVALGYTEEEVTSDGFDPEIDELKSRELLCVVGQKQKYQAEEGVMDNEVKGFRPLTSTSGDSNLL